MAEASLARAGGSPTSARIGKSALRPPRIPRRAATAVAEINNVYVNLALLEEAGFPAPDWEWDWGCRGVRIKSHE